MLLWFSDWYGLKSCITIHITRNYRPIWGFSVHINHKNHENCKSTISAHVTLCCISLDWYTALLFSITWFFTNYSYNKHRLKGAQSSPKTAIQRTSTYITINRSPYSSWDDQNGTVVGFRALRSGKYLPTPQQVWPSSGSLTACRSYNSRCLALYGCISRQWTIPAWS